MNIRITNLITLFLFIIAFIVYVLVLNRFDYKNEDTIIWLLSVLGIVELVFCFFTWKKAYGSLFSPYTIFLIFAFMFTYGQCIMWAFGVHTETEIGKRVMYSNILGIAQKNEIIKTQLLTLVGILGFHLGALFGCTRCSDNYSDNYSDDKVDQDKTIIREYERKILYKISLMVVVVAFPVTVYNSLRLLYIYRNYGYGANLYNSEVISNTNNLFVLIPMMFFPSLVGLLIGSQYRKNVMIACYSMFAVYALLCTLGGDRGEWLYPFVYLVWLHNTYQKKINVKQFVKYGVIGFFLMVMLSAIKNARTEGVSMNSLIDAIRDDSNPIASTLFETGRQMAIPLIFIRIGWGKYPYGNTYVMAFLGMVTERFIKAFIYPDFVGVSGWLSQQYLGISYGAGFSFIAEAYVNFGPYFSVIALIIIGYIYSKIMNVKASFNQNESLQVFFKITTAEALIISIRNPLLTALKTWMFSTVFIYLTCKLLLNTNNWRKTRSNGIT